MNFTVFLTSVAIFLFIIALSQNALTKHQYQKQRIKNLLKSQQDIIDEKLNIPFTERFLKPLYTNFMHGFAKARPSKKAEKTSSVKKLQRDLILAGIHISPEEYNALKTIIMGAIIGLTLIVLTLISIKFQIKILIILGSVILALLVPSFHLKAKIKKRQAEIRRQMPDTMDLLSVSIEAGLSFDGALTRLVQQTKNDLTEEFMLMLKEIQMGRSRRDALKDLGNRNDIPELRVFSTSMIQAEQYGISIKNVLAEQSSQIRISRRQTAEEKAMKAPVKMMLPIIGFIFPVVFIILLAPAAIDIMSSFGGK